MAFDFVKTAPKSVQDYSAVALPEHLKVASDKGNALKGARVIHVNSTAVGGGVAEILKSLVPLMSDSGPASEWMVIRGTDDFFETTKRLHNLLQGAEGTLTDDELNRYIDHNGRVAREIQAQGISPDVWVLHDPQTLPMTAFLPPGSQVIWVCHIDTTLPNRQVIEQLVPFMKKAARVVVSLGQYAVSDLNPDQVRIVPPAIDPLLPKNVERDPSEIRRTLAGLGIDTNRPLISQVSRFDYWKDPWGVIDAYRIVKERIPGVQLAMLGVIEAKDDPESFDVLETVRSHAGDDPDIHLYSDPAQVGQPEVGIVQQGADLIIQKSLREGFGLTVTEAMWKGTPVIGGNCGGIRVQIEDGRSGYLVDSVEECAQKTMHLLANPETARAIGDAARESVRWNFLTPRLLADYLSVVAEVAVGAAMEQQLSPGPGACEAVRPRAVAADN